MIISLHISKNLKVSGFVKQKTGVVTHYLNGPGVYVV